MKINDRVAVYGMLSPKEGGSVRMSNGKRGTIRYDNGKEGLEILMDRPVTNEVHDPARVVDGIHPKQCRLLKKKRNPASKFFNTLFVKARSFVIGKLRYLKGLL